GESRIVAGQAVVIFLTWFCFIYIDDSRTFHHRRPIDRDVFPATSSYRQKEPHPADLCLPAARAECALWLWRSASHLRRPCLAPRGELQKQLITAFEVHSWWQDTGDGGEM